MEPRVIMASKFKEQCLALLDEVARTKRAVVVTKRGKAVAQLVPLDAQTPRSTMGSVELLARADDAYFSTGAAWKAEEPAG